MNIVQHQCLLVCLHCFCFRSPRISVVLRILNVLVYFWLEFIQQYETSCGKEMCLIGYFHHIYSYFPSLFTKCRQIDLKLRPFCLTQKNESDTLSPNGSHQNENSERNIKTVITASASSIKSDHWLFPHTEKLVCRFCFFSSGFFDRNF